MADAQKQSQILRGEGDADSIRIYAEAFGVDKDFFAFYRSLQAYKDALSGSGHHPGAVARQRVLPLFRGVAAERAGRRRRRAGAALRGARCGISPPRSRWFS